MRISRLQIISAVVLLIVALSAASRAQDQKSPSQEERLKAVDLVRTVYAGGRECAEVTTHNGGPDNSRSAIRKL